MFGRVSADFSQGNAGILWPNPTQRAQRLKKFNLGGAVLSEIDLSVWNEIFNREWFFNPSPSLAAEEKGIGLKFSSKIVVSRKRQFVHKMFVDCSQCWRSLNPPSQNSEALEFLWKGPQTELRTLSQNCEQTLRTSRIVNKRVFLRAFQARMVSSCVGEWFLSEEKFWPRSHCDFQSFHFLSKENQVFLPRIHFSHPGPDGKSLDVHGGQVLWKWETTFP